MDGFHLDAGARLAHDVALGTAGAMGDEHCGTEHLLFGVVATASGDAADLMELFALDSLRVERAIRALRAHRCSDEHSVNGPALSTRAEIVLHAKPLAAVERLSPFDLLVGVLADPRSGAATVLRNLGVRSSEVRRLAELGAAQLGPHEVEGLIAALNRRREIGYPWWGPGVDDPVSRVALPDDRPQVLGRSETAVATLDNLIAGPEGFGLTVTITSVDAWILPPKWEPDEDLTSSIGFANRAAPDVVSIDLRYADGATISNRVSSRRWRADEPDHGVLVKLGSRTIVDDRNDRRVVARRSETSEWWAWPLPHSPEVQLAFDWPAEALSGVVMLDGARILDNAAALRSN